MRSHDSTSRAPASAWQIRPLFCQVGSCAACRALLPVGRGFRIFTADAPVNWLSSSSVLSALIATSFAAGLNVYATTLTLGLLGRTGFVTLPPALHPLQNGWVIAASAALFVIEFFGDKIPVFDLIWNALHTFVRVPVAALLSYLAADQLPPETKLLCTLLGGLIALVAHGGKTALRAAVTSSPEPISNAVLSLAEDAIAVALTWIATKHPYVAAAAAIVGVVAVLLVLKFVIRSLRELFRNAESAIET